MAISIGLDIGTSKLCAVAFDNENGSVTAQCYADNDSDITYLPPDLHEQDPGRILLLCRTLIKSLAATPEVKNGRVLSIGISGQMHGVMLSDPMGVPLTNLITWRDRRARPAVKGGKHTGCSVSEGYGGLTLGWLAGEGEIPEGATALSIGDFIAARLTGVVATSRYMSASWGIFDLMKGTYDTDVVKALSIPSVALPAIHDDSALGPLNQGIAGDLGLEPQVAVFPPIGDNQASVLGSIGIETDAMVVNIGTGAQVSVPVKKPVFIPGLETRPMPDGQAILVGASLCGGWSYSYLMRLFQSVTREAAGANTSENDVYNAMNRFLEGTSPGSEGVLTDTRFMGTRDNPSARGGISGLDGSNMTPGNLARSFLEGIASELVELAKPASAIGIKRLVASGNAVRKIPVMRQVLSDAFGIDCVPAKFTEEAAVGAARFAAGKI